jgi:hypothetical protein
MIGHVEPATSNRSAEEVGESGPLPASLLRTLLDDDLAQLALRLERHVTTLRRSATAIGEQLAEDYAGALARLFSKSSGGKSDAD